MTKYLKCQQDISTHSEIQLFEERIRTRSTKALRHCNADCSKSELLGILLPIGTLSPEFGAQPFHKMHGESEVSVKETLRNQHAEQGGT